MNFRLQIFEQCSSWSKIQQMPHSRHRMPLTLKIWENEVGVLTGQCLDRRMDNTDWLRSEISAWEARRNKQQVKIHWSFTIAVARNKLKKLYPVVENSNLPM